MEKKLPYSCQCIEQDDIEAVASSLKDEIITRGSHVTDFEDAIASYCDAEFAVAFTNGTAALQAAAFAADIAPGDRAITSVNTFISTIGSAMERGAKPFFVDIDLETGNLSLDLLKETINVPLSRGRNIVLPVHFGGLAVNMKQLESLITRPDTVVIEDAAHAIGSLYPSGEKVGSCAYSDMTIFSFHPVKNMTTGEGGMVTTNNADYAEKLKLFRNNGIVRHSDFAPRYYESEALTGNYNFTDMQAALGLSQLKKLPEFAKKRRELVRHYRSLLQNTAVKLFSADGDDISAYHLFVVQLPFDEMEMDRTQLMHLFNENQIFPQYHYIPLYRHPVIKKICGDIKEFFPAMENYYRQALSLPLFPQMDKTSVERVVKVLKSAL